MSETDLRRTNYTVRYEMDDDCNSSADESYDLRVPTSDTSDPTTSDMHRALYLLGIANTDVNAFVHNCPALRCRGAAVLFVVAVGRGHRPSPRRPHVLLPLLLLPLLLLSLPLPP